MRGSLRLGQSVLTVPVMVLSLLLTSNLLNAQDINEKVKSVDEIGIWPHPFVGSRAPAESSSVCRTISQADSRRLTYVLRCQAIDMRASETGKKRRFPKLIDNERRNSK